MTDNCQLDEKTSVARCRQNLQRTEKGRPWIKNDVRGMRIARHPTGASRDRPLWAVQCVVSAQHQRRDGEALQPHAEASEVTSTVGVEAVIVNPLRRLGRSCERA